MKEKILVPYAPILVESTRSIGYSFEAALADIIDNSIGKGALEVRVNFRTIMNPYILVIDDACGMDEKELEIAMRYGSQSSLEARDADDLGRFGLGLKMASLSQCRKLTVATKKNGSLNAAKWDLDHIVRKGSWSLLQFSNKDIKEIHFIEELEKMVSGTIVMWECFDRLENGTSNLQKVLDEKIEIARAHIALVFHRFMSDENTNKRVKIYFNNEKVEPYDPFLTNNPATQPLVERTFNIENSTIKVKPYILPFISKLTASDKKKIGDVNDLRQNQGFYVYRNKRLIIWGTWFRLIRQHELNKLARVRVDIPNTLDSIWEIDVKKSSASLPDLIKRNLLSIIDETIGRSERVYKYRGRSIKSDELVHVWNTVDNRGSFQYIVNRDLPLFKSLETSLDDAGLGYLDSLIKTIEDSFPYGDVYYRLAKNESNIQTTPLEHNAAYKIAMDMIEPINQAGEDINAFMKTLDKIDFFMKYPEVLKQIRREYSND